MADCCDDFCLTEEATVKQKKTLSIVLLINAVMFIAVLVAALISKSSSLLSGCIDNLGDSITYGLSLYVVSGGPVGKARVSLFKGCIILFAALSVSLQIVYKTLHPETPIFELMGIMTVFSLAANFACLTLLWNHKNEDINMASVWECSRNDVIENLAVLLAALGVWYFASGWPDIIIAAVLVFILYKSAVRIIKNSLTELRKVAKI